MSDPRCGWALVRNPSLGAWAIVTLSAACTTSSPVRFQGHIDFLADDRLEGRGVGSTGIEDAADYIADAFREAGLEPAGVQGTYFQPLSVTLRRKLTEGCRLTFSTSSRPLILNDDFTPLSFSSADEFSGEVVFCGYGIVAEDRRHDDFAHVDLSGKAALIVRGEPSGWRDDEGNATPHAMLRTKVYNAKDRGASAVLLVNREPIEGEPDELMAFEPEGADQYGIPAFHLSRATVDGLFAAAKLDSLTNFQQRMEAGAHTSTTLPGVQVRGSAGFISETISTRNVVGLLRGRGTFADEYVVIGAHYDHLGKCRPMARTFKAGRLVPGGQEPQIHNGADDNASGVAGLIEIARRAAGGRRPLRSLLFIAFTAEESGLHGSKHFTDHPVVPLDRIVVMLNMDMIGRMPPGSNRLEVFGTDSGAGIRESLEVLARRLRLTTVPSRDTGGRSDHAPFIRKRIPALHFFTGQHEDYHKPSDDSDRINARAGARVTALVGDLGLRLANRKDRPEFQEAAAPATAPGGLPAGSTPSYRVVMGLAPGYGDDGQRGMLVEAVNPEGPADLAGMKPGDRIIRVHGRDVQNIYDYMASTRNARPGDIVEVVVLRAGSEITLQVTLAAAR